MWNFSSYRYVMLLENPYYMDIEGKFDRDSFCFAGKKYHFFISCDLCRFSATKEVSKHWKNKCHEKLHFWSDTKKHLWLYTNLIYCTIKAPMSLFRDSFTWLRRSNVGINDECSITIKRCFGNYDRDQWTHVCVVGLSLHEMGSTKLTWHF